jgi:signal-transduction protein with cAMP-binding, CBS, and nucleotidyltransferase domain
MQEFIKLLKAKESYKKEKKLLDYILNLSSHLDYMYIPKNMILMNFGDKGDKAYINLSGEVDIMVPNSKIMSVYENDYLLYIASLIKYREYSLINSIINENFPNYPIIIYDDFTPTEEILSIFENTNKKEKKLSTFIKGNNNEIIKKLLDINNIIHHLKIENSRGKSQKSINISKNFDMDGEQSEEQNQKNTMEKALKLNASNEELMSSLELYIISIRQLLDLFDFSYLNDNDELITNCSSEEYITLENISIHLSF